MSDAPFFRRLVVGVEGPRSDPAVLAALTMGRELGSEVELVHADEEDGRTQETLEDHVQRLVASHGLGTVPPLQRLSGEAHAVLARHADRIGATLVLGPHQRRGFLDLGSTARSLLAKSRAGIWVQPSVFVPPRRILVPVDLTRESLLALDVGLQLARAFGAGATVLHCFQPPEIAYPGGAAAPTGAVPTGVVEQARSAAEEAFAEALADVDWSGVPHEGRFVEGYPATTLLELQDDFDAIVLSTHGRTGLAALLQGGVADRVLKKAHVPVVAVRAPADPALPERPLQGN